LQAWAERRLKPRLRPARGATPAPFRRAWPALHKRWPPVNAPLVSARSRPAHEAHLRSPCARAAQPRTPPIFGHGPERRDSDALAGANRGPLGPAWGDGSIIAHPSIISTPPARCRPAEARKSDSKKAAASSTQARSPDCAPRIRGAESQRSASPDRSPSERRSGSRIALW